MPHKVVYCTTKYQGLGLKHLYDLQGSDGTRLLLQELNQQGTTNAMIQCVLDTIQMELGIGSPILEENRPLNYIEWGGSPAFKISCYTLMHQSQMQLHCPPYSDRMTATSWMQRSYPGFQGRNKF
jgi:hypothetical protein